MTVSLLKCRDNQEVLEKLRGELTKRESLLPTNSNASIVIKPNLNSCLDALTGNTTDLRVLGAILQILTERGYTNVAIIEGPNGGFHRDGIDVFARNRVAELAKRFGVECRDINYEKDIAFVHFEGAGDAQFAGAFRDCDFFINVPKLKTHYETLVSVSLKSLVGILVGRANKVKVHASLHENILRLNDEVRPDLHIVDGLIAMEGTGPSAGFPVRADLLLVGEDAYEVEITASGIMGFEPHECPLIQRAVETGRISGTFPHAVESVAPAWKIKPFERPNLGILAKLIRMPLISGIARQVRNSVFVSNFLKRYGVRKTMFFLGLTQEVIRKDERKVKLVWNESACKSSGKCVSYCPRMLDLPKSLSGENDDCLNCLYCYAVCPNKAIGVEGELGYYKEQMERYGKIIKKIA